MFCHIFKGFFLTPFGSHPQTFQWMIKIVIMVIVNLIVNIVKHQAPSTRHALLEHVESSKRWFSSAARFCKSLAMGRRNLPRKSSDPCAVRTKSLSQTSENWVTTGGQLWSSGFNDAAQDTTKWCTRCGAENSTSWPKWLLFLARQQKIVTTPQSRRIPVLEQKPATECSRTSRSYICSYKSFNWWACVIFSHEFVQPPLILCSCVAAAGTMCNSKWGSNCPESYWAAFSGMFRAQLYFMTNHTPAWMTCVWALWRPTVTVT